MACTPDQLTKFKSDLLKNMRDADLLPTDQKTNETFLERRLAVAIAVLDWLDGSVHKTKLMRFAGLKDNDDYSPEVAAILGEWTTFLEQNDGRFFRYCRGFLDSIREVCDTKDLYYGLTKPIHYFDRNDMGISTNNGNTVQSPITGQELIAWINDMYDPYASKVEHEHLCNLIAGAFRRISPQVQTDIVHSRNSTPVVHVSARNGASHFLFTVAPSLGALREDDANRAIVGITSVRNRIKNELGLQDPDLKMLVVAPSLNNQALTELIQGYSNLYHFWGISVPRFFNYLYEVLHHSEGLSDAAANVTTSALVAARLDTFIPNDPNGKLSTLEGVQRIQQVIQEKKT